MSQKSNTAIITVLEIAAAFVALVYGLPLLIKSLSTNNAKLATQTNPQAAADASLARLINTAGAGANTGLGQLLSSLLGGGSKGSSGGGFGGGSGSGGGAGNRQPDAYDEELAYQKYEETLNPPGAMTYDEAMAIAQSEAEAAAQSGDTSGPAYDVNSYAPEDFYPDYGSQNPSYDPSFGSDAGGGGYY